MQTREELLNGLDDAVSVIRQLANVQQRLTNVRNEYKSHLPKTKREKRLSWCIFIIVSFMIGGFLHGIIGWILGDFVYIGGFVAGFFIRKKYYEYKNEKIDQENQVIKGKEQAVLADLQKVQAVYREKVGYWYPANYCSVDAVEFFRDVISNYRADSLKEAINLYETTLHQRRLENTQKQALKEQRYANMANLVMQGAVLGEMSRHNATMEFEMKTANRTLDNIRNGF